MNAIVASRSTALLLLRPPATPGTAPPRPGAREGRLSEGPARVDAGAASQALFSVNTVTPEKQVIRLLERAGAVFGLDRSRYASLTDFASAIKAEFNALLAKPADEEKVVAIGKRLSLDADTVALLKQQKDPKMIVDLIEKHLGLDQLGVSFATLLNAGLDPRSAEAETLRKALEAVRERNGETAPAGRGAIRRDRDGTYAPDAAGPAEPRP
ncbi:hypothetical protein [Methylobacterium sp. 4-46]|nr:hypothetical protein [Methylobacterium sp. 4-46]